MQQHEQNDAMIEISPHNDTMEKLCVENNVFTMFRVGGPVPCHQVSDVEPPISEK